MDEFYLGQHEGKDVYCRVENGRPIVRVGKVDLAYPLDLNGNFKRWVDRRALQGGPDFATAN